VPHRLEHHAVDPDAFVLEMLFVFQGQRYDVNVMTEIGEEPPAKWSSVTYSGVANAILSWFLATDLHG
jgi:hypothetical protein